MSNKAGVKKKGVRDVHCCTAYFDPGMTTLTKQERPFKLLSILFKHKDPQITAYLIHITPEAPLSALKSAIAENGMGVTSRH